MKAVFQSTSYCLELYWVPLTLPQTEDKHSSPTIGLNKLFHLFNSFTECFFGIITLCAKLNIQKCTLYCVLLCTKQCCWFSNWSWISFIVPIPFIALKCMRHYTSDSANVSVGLAVESFLLREATPESLCRFP